MARQEQERVTGDQGISESFLVVRPTREGLLRIAHAPGVLLAQCLTLASILLYSASCTAGNGATATGGIAGLAAPKPPNVVLFLADDQTWFDSGAYGNQDVPTPNIDRLASEGMRFTHAFTGTAMCAPTRQQLYTGLYPVRSGAYPNHSRVREGTRSLVHYFRDLGYRVALTGKEHFGPASSFPFERLREKGADRQRREAVDLDAAGRFMSRESRQPFFLVVASNSPHTPWTEGNPSQFDLDAIDVPGHLVDTPETRKALVAYYAEITHLDGQLGRVLSALESSGEQNNTILIYTSEQGSSLPFAKWTLYDAGVRTAMVVRWPGQVAAGATSDAMVHYVDVVPTLVDAAGSELADVDGRSFLPVLLGQSEEHREHVFGAQTTRGVIHGTDYPSRSVRSRQYKLILNLAAANGFRNLLTLPPRNGVLASWEGVAPDRARAYLERPEVELYDLEADPWELDNLAMDPEHRGVVATHRAVLDEWMRSVGDHGLETELEALDHMNPRIVERIRLRFGDGALPREASGHE